MGMILGPDIIKDPSVTATTVTFAGQNIITIGGQQYVLNSPVMNSAITGFGGLDTGSLAAVTMYNLFAVTTGGAAGIVASVNSIPLGFVNYEKIGEFFVNSDTDISYAYSITNQKDRVVIQDTGSLGAGSIASNDYNALDCGVAIGTGLWSAHASIRNGNVGGSQEGIFLTMVFADVDGANTVSAPDGTLVDTYIIGESRSFTKFQMANGGQPVDFNSMSLNHTIKLNVTAPMTLFAVGRLQAFFPAFSTMTGAIVATRLGPVIV